MVIGLGDLSMDTHSQKRWRTWQDHLSQMIGDLEMRATEDFFDAKVEFAAPGSVLFARTEASGNWIKTNKKQSQSNNQDRIRVVIPRRGTVGIAQGGRDALVKPGAFTLYDATNPVNIGSDASYVHSVVTLPRAPVLLHTPGIEELMSQRFDMTTPAMRVFMTLANEFENMAPVLVPHSLDSYTSVLSDALSIALSSQLQEASKNSDRALSRVMRLMTERLRDPDFSIDEIIVSEGLSERSLFRLFQSKGFTPWSWVIQRRLQGIASDLQDPRNAKRKIADIAFSWGFSEPSHFTRAFKAHFKMTPRDWRAAHNS